MSRKDDWDSETSELYPESASGRLDPRGRFFVSKSQFKLGLVDRRNYTLEPKHEGSFSFPTPWEGMGSRRSGIY